MAEQADEFNHGAASSTYLTPPSSPTPSYNKVPTESLSRERTFTPSFHKVKELQYRPKPQRSSTICSEESYIFVPRPTSVPTPRCSREFNDSALSDASQPPSDTLIAPISTATAAPVVDITVGPPGCSFSLFGTYNLGDGRRGAISGPSAGYREGVL